jgi:hypothetical protein
VRRAAALAGLCLLLAACGSSAGSSPPVKHRRTGGIPRGLLAEVRPIGRGPRFQPRVRGPVGSACRAPLGRRLQAHVELFGANRVVLLAAGIGTRAPRRFRDGSLVSARCFGRVVTLDPTGTVYFRPGATVTVGDLFRAWGESLTAARIASFSGAGVRVYVDGLRSSTSPGAIPLKQDQEIVLEVGPYVPPHARFSFPTLPSPQLR